MAFSAALDLHGDELTGLQGRVAVAVPAVAVIARWSRIPAPTTHVEVAVATEGAAPFLAAATGRASATAQAGVPEINDGVGHAAARVVPVPSAMASGHLGLAPGASRRIEGAPPAR